MARTSNIFARVEPEIKKQAERVLDQLGSADYKKLLGIYYNKH